MAAQMQSARRVLAGRKIDGAAACRAAGVDGLLNGGAGIVRLAAAGAVVFDVEDGRPGLRETDR